MKTKNVLLVLGGVAVGYLAFKFNWFKSAKTKVVEVASDVKEAVLDTEKATKCEQEWVDKIGSMTKFASQEASEQSKSAYVKDCMSK